MLCKNSVETIAFNFLLSYVVKVVSFLVVRVSWATAVSSVSLFVENFAFGMVECSQFHENFDGIKLLLYVFLTLFYEILTSKLIFYFPVGHNNVQVKEMLKRIPAESRKKLSGKGYFPQDGYILEHLPVPPNCLSVPDISDGVSVMSSVSQSCANQFVCHFASIFFMVKLMMYFYCCLLRL